MKTTKLLTYLGIVLTLLVGTISNAQVKVSTPKGDLDFRMVGRTSLDFGSYLGADDDKSNRNGVQVNDTRLGFIATFDTVWTAKVEICFASKAISFRDAYVRRSFNNGKQELTIGNDFLPYGQKLAGINYKFIETAAPDNTFTESRKLGIWYGLYEKHFNLIAAIASNGNIDTKATNQGYNFATRVLLRPIFDNGNVLHITVAPSIVHLAPNGTVTYTGYVPASISTNNLISSHSFEAYNVGRLNVTALGIVRRFFAEAHFNMAWVNGKNTVDETDPTVVMDNNYSPMGFFVQTGFRIFGENQGYNSKTGVIPNANGKSLEVLLRYSYTDLNDNDFDYGKLNNITLGVNYYFNKYLRAKVNYVHSIADVDGEDKVNVDYIQARMQFSF